MMMQAASFQSVFRKSQDSAAQTAACAREPQQRSCREDAGFLAPQMPCLR